MKRNFAAFNAFLASLIRVEAPRYQPTRPSILSEIHLIETGIRKGKRGRRSSIMVERLFDNTRYPGQVLREIRKGGQTHECARRVARGCVQ